MLELPIQETLRTRFGFPAFRPYQEQIIRSVLSGGRTLAILPTAFGKSLCYQLPALLLDGPVLVFSPLISLMKDQCDQLRGRFGVPAVAIHSDLLQTDPEGYELALEGIRRGDFRLIFAAPEKIDNPRFLQAVAARPISLAVVDEAHCISLWGHDFRPHYRRIAEFVARIRAPRVLGLTATASPEVERDIALQLGGDCRVIRARMARENLQLRVLPVAGDREKLATLAGLLPTLEGSGILYVGTREECQRVHGFLEGQGISSRFYHGGIREHRSQIQEGFMEDRWRVTVATNALGMGVDKPNIRFIIHYRFPSSPEHYYQEIGRAGRDGLSAEIILLHDPADADLQSYFIESSFPSEETHMQVYCALDLDEPQFAGRIEAACDLSRTEVMVTLENLVDMRLARKTTERDRTVYVRLPGTMDFRFRDQLRARKEQALRQMMGYPETRDCRMNYLIELLGDRSGVHCGHCDRCAQFPPVALDLAAADDHMANWRPAIEPAGSIHRGGIALDFYGGTATGRSVASVKYGEGRFYPADLTWRASEAIRARYPLDAIDGVTAVPSTVSGGLAQDFARRVSDFLQKPYWETLRKTRATRPQKEIRGKYAKRANVAEAFAHFGHSVNGKRLLLIDDICDSGWTLRECARVLKNAGAAEVHVFAIARTKHAHDE